MPAPPANPFTFAVDKNRRLITFTPSGMWKPADAAAMIAEFERATKALGPGSWYLLLDATHWAPQVAEVQEAIVKCMQQNKRSGLKRAARVVDASVVKLQLDRLAQQSTHDHKDFADASSALTWLFSGS